MFGYYFPNFVGSTSPVAAPAGSAIETDDLPWLATYWPRNGVDRDGEPTVGDPVEISSRWTHEQDEVNDANRGVIFTDIVAKVDRDIAIGSLIFLGAEANYVSGTSQLYEVISFRKIGDVKGRKYRRTVGLIRYSLEHPG